MKILCRSFAMISLISVMTSLCAMQPQAPKPWEVAQSTLRSFREAIDGTKKMPIGVVSTEIASITTRTLKNNITADGLVIKPVLDALSEKEQEEFKQGLELLHKLLSDVIAPILSQKFPDSAKQKRRLSVGIQSQRIKKGIDFLSCEKLIKCFLGMVKQDDCSDDEYNKTLTTTAIGLAVEIVKLKVFADSFAVISEVRVESETGATTLRRLSSSKFNVESDFIEQEKAGSRKGAYYRSFVTQECYVGKMIKLLHDIYLSEGKNLQEKVISFINNASLTECDIIHTILNFCPEALVGKMGYRDVVIAYTKRVQSFALSFAPQAPPSLPCKKMILSS